MLCRQNIRLVLKVKKKENKNEMLEVMEAVRIESVNENVDQQMNSQLNDF